MSKKSHKSFTGTATNNNVRRVFGKTVKRIANTPAAHIRTGIDWVAEDAFQKQLTVFVRTHPGQPIPQWMRDHMEEFEDRAMELNLAAYDIVMDMRRELVGSALTGQQDNGR